MSATILITGCSSGFGRAAALHFADKGWNVIATMRDPTTWSTEEQHDSLLIVPLDVTDHASIDAAIAAGIDRFGRIDCMVNNAGRGLLSIFEATPMDTIRDVFETNFFGPLQATRAILPHFKSQGGGRIVTVTSGSTLVPDSLMSVYSASKAALDSFVESVHWELTAQNVTLKLVVPGFVPTTGFVEQTQTAATALEVPPAYQSYVDQRLAACGEDAPSDLASEQAVAETIVEAAIDTSERLRFLVGADTAINAHMRFETSEDEYQSGTRSRFEAR